ncbi:hypothetical protein COCC4DRAFT_132570 [Bipolaris maydis ATCC 48331]|nr:uncharacterized protein COCC4DRAFT_132570 [Bipolaris maydis ATCC 48331]KAH7562361.1 hypothetical protein BM1_01881 [Bipolaris maydis]ENI07128.1 hypothetical protein COCC4DRAFT_132570 [Bipolaris maydis ATCC 48331]KAJ5027743.1 hypothetical protein J3E73DRAFT_368139 [Bipolaris maydis]KAJ5046885.1 hypothetical protein J3E74DRAFT_230362 [Bipolaris maydis]KAJ5062499.1 hypothetical protein J3E74DRAFT_404150 [Bipolaris maydis]
MDRRAAPRRKRLILADEGEPQDNRSKRSRTCDTASDAVPESPTSCPSPLNPPVRTGLATPEPSNLSECEAASSCPTVDDVLESPFPFMKLPAELRIHIYHMALVREEPLLLHADRAPEKPDEDEFPPAPAPVLRRVWFHGPEQRPYLNQRGRGQSPGPERIPLSDPIIPEILRLNKQIYKEARQVLYSDNVFTLSLTSGIHTLSTLHQRSRSLIKHVVLTIPSHHDILDGFADLVRLGLRYCWGLKTFKIILQASLPDDGRMTGATSVYANAFHILRWLPRGCNVGLEGNVSDTVKKVVAEEGRLQAVLDEASYLKRQHQMPERH